MGRDNRVSWQGKPLRIPPQLHRQHGVKAILRVHEYPDGRLALFGGPRCLARFGADGAPADAVATPAMAA